MLGSPWTNLALALSSLPRESTGECDGGLGGTENSWQYVVSSPSGEISAISRSSPSKALPSLFNVWKRSWHPDVGEYLIITTLPQRGT